jgi:hypothetical protein
MADQEVVLELLEQLKDDLEGIYRHTGDQWEKLFEAGD